MNILNGLIGTNSDTSTNWILHDPIIPKDTLVYESDTNKYKLGDGISKYSDLEYPPEIPKETTTPIPDTVPKRTATGQIKGADPIENDDLVTLNRLLSMMGTISNNIPSGGIIMWAGAINAIPSGWVLCDGTNGTPNLRDRFVVGAGTTYTVGNVGGSASVTPTGTIASTTVSGTVGNTTLATWQMPNHQHTFAGGSPDSYIGFSCRSYASGTINGVCNAHEQNLNDHNYIYMNWSGGGDGAHNHTFTGSAHGHTFTGSAATNLPPYYALAYIMKL